MDNEVKDTKGSIVHKIFPDGVSFFLVLEFATFIINRFLDHVWINYTSIAIVGFYIIWTVASIFSSKVKPIMKLPKKELLFYQVILPSVLSVLIGFICVSVTGNVQMSLFENAIVWIRNSSNQLFMSIVFSILVLICYFIATGRVSGCTEAKIECQYSDDLMEVQRQNKEKFDELFEKVENIQTVLAKKSQVAYTATCIPVKYNRDHDTFVFVLVENISHEKSRWMFPGSHVEVSNNQMREMFELTDLNIVPGKVIEDKVKKEAGLMDLQFIDPYYEKISFENTTNGKEQRSYPNTCYPAKAPIFNYLFRVSEYSKCYKEQNHRCHYDFTYIGEYSMINEKEAGYDVVEVEFNRNKNFKGLDYTEAIAHISSKLGEQINKKIKKKKKIKNQFNTPFDQLCLDSIPEMIYNAILFYSDYIEFKD